MRTHNRTTTAVGLLVLAVALVFGTRLLTAGSEAFHFERAPDARPPHTVQSAPAAVTPLPDFKPSEELPADAAVAFPTDI